jgi:hypothetical protein
MNYRDGNSLDASNVMVPKSTIGYPRRTAPQIANVPQNLQIAVQHDYYLARSALESVQSRDAAIREALLTQQVDNSSENATSFAFRRQRGVPCFQPPFAQFSHIDF